jgi:hypothetical protein
MSSYCWAGDVGQVGSDTGRVHDIVEGELGDKLAGLEEEGQWLCGVNCCTGAESCTCIPVQCLQRLQRQRP